MPRKSIIRSNEHYFHLVGRSNNKEYFDLPLEMVWKILTDQLAKLQKQFDLKIAAFVLMNNHFHLLLLTPNADIDWVMFYFMKDTTKIINKHSGRINRVYGSRYRGCLIDNYHYLLSAYKYIYQNPIRAGLSDRAQNYKYSTLNSSIHFPFKIEEIVPLTLQSRNKELEARWINETFTADENSSIRTGLRKSKFSYKKHRTNKIEIKPDFKF